MRIKFIFPVLAAGVLLLTLLCQPVQAEGGGCPMCKASASALGEDGQRSLNYGILMMMVPVSLAFGTIGYLLFKRRHSGADA